MELLPDILFQKGAKEKKKQGYLICQNESAFDLQDMDQLNKFNHCRYLFSWD